MLSSLSRKPALLSLLGAVVLSAPAFATDFSEGADFGGTYSYIGPGVASLPDVDVDVGPLGAGVYVEPGVAFMFGHGLCRSGFDLDAGLSGNPRSRGASCRYRRRPRCDWR